MTAESSQIMKGTENPHYEEQLKEFSLFTLEKRILRGHVTTAFQYLKNSYKESHVSSQGQDKGQCVQVAPGGIST